MRLNIINKRKIAVISKIKKSSNRLKFGLGTLALVSLCLLLLIIGTFTQLKYDITLPASSPVPIYHFEYIPQIPVVIFIAALLGSRWGLFTVILYIALGLFSYYPVFGLGGGLSYIFQYNFGYIAAYIFAVYFSSKELKKKNFIISNISAVLYGVIIIHIIGIIYFTITAIMKHDTISFIYDFIYYQSFSKILYDVIFSIIAMIIARSCRKLLWIING